ncbi:MAG: hypothetical protein MR964_03895, partial [Campylobacter sp.]|uniref:hypothetical protein n=1 Tax=Campylobacter sp. TaxID=205 RepID=UPI002AA71B72
NLRTLVSEASAYYVAHGTFGSGATAANWNAVTNVPLSAPTAAAVRADGTDPTAHLRAGGQDCIGVRLVNKNGNVPAHIILTRNATNNTGNSVCQQVLASQAVTNYFNSTVPNGTGTIANAIPVSSSRGIYQAAPVPETPREGERREGVGVGG